MTSMNRSLLLKKFLNQNTVAVVYCMLNEFSRKAVQLACVLFHFSILPGHNNECISLNLPFPFKRRAFLL